MVNLVSLCCDVCVVLKHKTGFHRLPLCRSTAQPRAFKHEQIKARGFVPGMMDCCKFNVVSSEMWMMLLFFSCLDDPVGPTHLQCWGGRFSLCLHVSSSVFDLRPSTHYLAVAFLFFLFFGSILLCWTCSASPTHFCGAAGATSVPQRLFLSAFLKLYYHFYM